jgi:folate-binding protein YgfZ
MDYCRLEDSGLVVASGPDAITFLQGQFTNDLRQLGAGGVVLAACNTPQGRVAALARAFERDGEVWLLVPRGAATPLVERLRRYVLRAKVKLRDASAEFAFAALLHGGGSPSHERGTGSLSRVRSRAGTLLIASPDELAAALEGGRRLDAAHWHAAAIAAGEPEVRPEAAEEWIAQMLNLDLLDGISFTKGCYTGQEIVARTQHLGRIKRRMFRYRADGDQALAPKQALLLDGAKVGEAVTSVSLDGRSEALAVVSLAARDRPLVDEAGVRWEPAPLPYEVPAADAG